MTDLPAGTYSVPTFANPIVPFTPYKNGDKVRKVKGHQFIGTIVSVFITLEGNLRYVVESTVEGAKGLLFILNHEQLEKREDV
jgi:hypothetical protein